MGFIDLYKHLEKLCGDMLCTQYGISAYVKILSNVFDILLLPCGNFHNSFLKKSCYEKTAVCIIFL